MIDKNGMRAERTTPLEKALADSLYALNRAMWGIDPEYHDRPFDREDYDILRSARDTVWEMGVTRFGWKD
jgi:hypothetical protein